MSSAEVLDRMQQAMTAHDLEALVACFAEDYDCEMPTHPALSFVGRDNVRRNWTGLFAHVPDLKASVLRSAHDRDLLWSEWEMTGTTVAGGGYLARGAAILRAEDGQVAWARFYLDPVEDPSAA
ncbi:MAG TPA: nuclear transport factor 2 family protein [Streptosporangiaceae bacterium]|jgi:ketosteroid isomerase-like protein|nr:nuclear transport factor 2 family protein [Streptosporangiaceae bacterium]